MTDSIRITENIEIPLADIKYRYSRSSGPGGQHVNTSDTRVTLLFDISRSAVFQQALSENKYARFLSRLKKQLNKDGVLQISCQQTRSQLKNKEIALDQLTKIIKQALVEPKPRKKTKPSKAAKQKRLNDKKRRSEVKAGRRKTW